MKIIKFSLFEKIELDKDEKIETPENTEDKDKETKEVDPERIPDVKDEEEKEEETIKESIKTFDNFKKINEDGEGGGTAYATAGNTTGMGAIVAPTVSPIPGDVAGSTPGSGDLPAYDQRTHFGSKGSKKPKKYKRTSKKKRHTGTDEHIENMYVTYFDDWLNSDYTNKKNTNEKIINENKIAQAIQDAIEMWYSGNIKKATNIINQLTELTPNEISGVLLISNVDDAMENLMAYEKN